MLQNSIEEEDLAELRKQLSGIERFSEHLLRKYCLAPKIFDAVDIFKNASVDVKCR